MKSPDDAMNRVLYATGGGAIDHSRGLADRLPLYSVCGMLNLQSLILGTRCMS